MSFIQFIHFEQIDKRIRYDKIKPVKAIIKGLMSIFNFVYFLKIIQKGGKMSTKTVEKVEKDEKKSKKSTIFALKDKFFEKKRYFISFGILSVLTILGLIYSIYETRLDFVIDNLSINKADTAFMFISTLLVMIMTPGLALFYGGMVRKKNVLGTLMQSFISLGLITIIWVLVGYSLAFGPDKCHLIGGLDWALLRNVGLIPSESYATNVPHYLFMLFQMMFAALTPALITGSFAGRFRFKSFMIFLALWVLLIYCPLAHWVWGEGGWIRNLGGLDFAGGLVVHIGSGAAALAACLILGKRHGYKKEIMPPHNLTLTFIGTTLLWFGWFGFNGGSALEANSLAISALAVTQVAAAAGMMSWLLVEWAQRDKPTMLGAMSGVLAGLVGITPAAGFVSVSGALAIGFLSGAFCYYCVSLKSKLGYDDSLDAVGIHGSGGVLGSILTGVFASTLINPDGANGLIFGSFHLLKIQLISTIAAVVFSFIGTYILLKIVDKFSSLRLSEEEEMQGLDITQHSENCYRF